MMPIKPDAKPWSIPEQIIEDPATGLTFQFEVVPDGELRLRVFGETLPYGNREFQFNQEGERVGAGIFVAGQCRPTWMMPID